MPNNTVRPIATLPPIATEAHTELVTNLRMVRGYMLNDRGRATVDEAIQAIESRERVTCGVTDPDPYVEELIIAMREAQNAPQAFDGCGRAGEWNYMYRCVECGRWMHKGCILRHFESHRTSPSSDSAASNEGDKPEEASS